MGSPPWPPAWLALAPLGFEPTEHVQLREQERLLQVGCGLYAWDFGRHARNCPMHRWLLSPMVKTLGPLSARLT
jgi:hypothetical protein